MPHPAKLNYTEYLPAYRMRADAGIIPFENATLRGHGLPDQRIVCTDLQWVQEQLTNACVIALWPLFRPAENASAPTVDLRFTVPK
jgi:hypothetical protein